MSTSAVKDGLMSQTVSRATEILEMTSRDPRSLAEIGARLGVHRTTVLRLLHTLADAGLQRETGHTVHLAALRDGRRASGSGAGRPTTASSRSSSTACPCPCATPSAT